MTRIVYVSTDSMPFVPVEVTDPYVPDRTEYPLVLEEPNGIAQPKYDWATSEWVENTTGSIADQLSALQDSVSTLTDAIALSVVADANGDDTDTKKATDVAEPIDGTTVMTDPTDTSEKDTASESTPMSASEA